MVNVGKKKRSCVGLEFSGDRVRVAMVEPGPERPRLVACGGIQFGPNQVQDGEVLEPERVAEDIGALFRDLHLNPRNVVTSLSGRAVIMKKIQMDSMAEDLARDTIQGEAAEHLPFDIRDVCLDFHLLRDGLPSNKMEVLLVAARREVIASRQALLGSAGLGLSVIDVDAFAVQRAWESNYDVPPGTNVVLVHVGDQVTSLNVVRDGMPVFVRDLPLATSSFVRSVESRAGLTSEEAAQAVFADPATASTAVAEARQASAEALSMEIERSFAYMRASDEVGALSNLVLSGEGARLPGLAQHLSDFLRLPVELADPFRRLQLDAAALGGANREETGPGLVIAVGLALRGRN
jgi:type IV pilus assembly protein PilM